MFVCRRGWTAKRATSATGSPCLRILAAVCSIMVSLGVSLGAAGRARATPNPEQQIPDLGQVRYHDPFERRAIWLSPSVSGVVIPRSFGLFDRTVWMVRPTFAWAVAVLPRFAVGGLHALAWYDASNIRLRVHEHTLQLSGRPIAPRPRLDNRLFVALTTHSAENSRVDGRDFALGGIKDLILSAGYGMEHDLGKRWQLAWGTAFRYVWVFLDTQRQVRWSVRGAFEPRAGHRLSADAKLYYVHRDEDQFGNPLPRHGAHVQGALQYDWLSRHDVGLWVRARATNSFLSGEAPMYEVREEALNNAYGDLLIGFLAVWR